MHRSPAAAGLRLLPDQLAAGAGSAQWAGDSARKGIAPATTARKLCHTCLRQLMGLTTQASLLPSMSAAERLYQKAVAESALHASTHNIRVTSPQHLRADWLQWGESP